MVNQQLFEQLLRDEIGNPIYSDKTIVKPKSFVLSKFTDDPYYYTKKREMIANQLMHFY